MGGLRWGTRLGRTEPDGGLGSPGGRRAEDPRVPLSSTQEADAVRDALVPSLACAAAHAGNLDVLQALVELVRPPPLLGDQPQPC